MGVRQDMVCRSPDILEWRLCDEPSGRK
jgi:hypothetical protein